MSEIQVKVEGEIIAVSNQLDAVNALLFELATFLAVPHEDFTTEERLKRADIVFGCYHVINDVNKKLLAIWE